MTSSAFDVLLGSLLNAVLCGSTLGASDLFELSQGPQLIAVPAGSQNDWTLPWRGAQVARYWGTHPGRLHAATLAPHTLPAPVPSAFYPCTVLTQGTLLRPYGSQAQSPDGEGDHEP